jgi:hypothetical protein
MEYNYKRRGSIVFPVLLVGLGIVFLLNNLGYLGWDVWLVIGRMWPVLLIAIGVDVLLGRRSAMGAALSLVIILALFAGGVWFFYNTTPRANDYRTETISRPLDDAGEAEVTIDFSVGTFNVDATGDTTDLLSGSLDLYPGESLSEDFRTVGDKAYYKLGTQNYNNPGFWFFPPIGPNTRTWDLLLNADFPIMLDIDAGVGEGNLDLRGMTLEGINIDSGVGELTLYLPADGDFDVDISGGVGEVTVFVASDAPMRITVDGGLGNTSFDSDFYRHGDAYVSEAYEAGGDVIDLNIDGGVGSVSVRTIE